MTASRTQPPILWDVATGKAKRLRTKISPMPFDVAISPDMKRIAVGLANSEIDVMDPISAETVQTLTPKTEKSANVLALEFNPKDPKMLAASLQNGDILIWNVDQSTYETLSGSGGSAYNLSFSRDGQFLAASSDDRVIRIWSTDKLKDKPIQLRGIRDRFTLSPTVPSATRLCPDRRTRLFEFGTSVRRSPEMRRMDRNPTSGPSRARFRRGFRRYNCHPDSTRSSDMLAKAIVRLLHREMAKWRCSLSGRTADRL